MSLRRWWYGSLSVGLALAALPATAAAEGDTPAAAAPAPQPDAAELKRQGDAAFDAWRYAEALDAYQRAYTLSNDPALLYNQGRALQALGSYAEGLAELERFEHDASPELRSRVPRLNELIAELRAHTALLTLRGNVDGARVSVNHRPLGALPLPQAVRLNAGKATLEVMADGYAPFQRLIELPPGGILVLEALLIPKNRSGLLSVRSHTPGAFVAIDDKPIGNTPTELMVEAGMHRVTLRAEGYEPTTLSTVVEVGTRKDLDITLDPTRPITSRWWFWTGVSAVVVGGVVLTAALLSEKKADHGDFQPGQLSAPLSRPLFQF